MIVTNRYYQDNAKEFFDSTVNADVSQLYVHFLKYIPAGGKILDLGCGSGRDTKAFLTMGYDVDAIDGSRELCKLASEYTGIEVRCLDFAELDASVQYDGIWACASLLHISYSTLNDILTRVYKALNPNGVLYMSFKKGDSDEYRNGRFFTDMNDRRFFDLHVDRIGFDVAEKWESVDAIPERNNDWFNVVLTRK